MVWVSKLDRDTRAGEPASVGSFFGQLAGAFGLGMVGKVVTDLTAQGVTKATMGESQRQKIYVSYCNRKPTSMLPTMTCAAVTWRDAWPGSESLRAKSWAYVSQDEKGTILLPCDSSCQTPPDAS